MKAVSVKLSEIAKDPTMRMDAQYWIDKKTSVKAIRTEGEIRKKHKELVKIKSKLIKENKEEQMKSPVTDKIHNRLIDIINLQIITLSWVLGNRKDI
jgi:hypothetical protein